MNVIFDILESPAFQKYSTCWVFQALCIFVSDENCNITYQIEVGSFSIQNVLLQFYIADLFPKIFAKKLYNKKSKRVWGGPRLIWTLNKIISGFEFTGSGAPLLGVKAINKWTKLGCHIDLTNEQTREESATSTQLLTR